MRGLFLTVLAAICLITSSFSIAMSPNMGGEVPFPLEKLVPFPWKQIEGTWNVERSQQPQVYFDVLYVHPDGVRVVQVTMYDTSGQIYARGSGAIGIHEKTLRAIMSTNTGDTFLLFVRAYANVQDCQEGRMVVVLTERQMEQRQKVHDHHFIIHKPTDPSICSHVGIGKE